MRFLTQKIITRQYGCIIIVLFHLALCVCVCRGWYMDHQNKNLSYGLLISISVRVFVCYDIIISLYESLRHNSQSSGIRPPPPPPKKKKKKEQKQNKNKVKTKQKQNKTKQNQKTNKPQTPLVAHKPLILEYLAPVVETNALTARPNIVRCHILHNPLTF